MLMEIEEIIVLVFDERPKSMKIYFKEYSSYSRIFLLKTS